MRKAMMITTELGLEKKCTKCGDWWPADKEFYNSNGGGKLHSKCKACERELIREKRTCLALNT